MMNKKLTLIGLLLSLTLSLTAVAAEDYHHGGDTDKRVEHLTQVLGLNADQQTKLKALFDAQQVKLKAVHEETQTGLKAILTPEQSAKLDALHTEHQKVSKDKK